MREFTVVVSRITRRGSVALYESAISPVYNISLEPLSPRPPRTVTPLCGLVFSILLTNIHFFSLRCGIPGTIYFFVSVCFVQVVLSLLCLAASYCCSFFVIFFLLFLSPLGWLVGWLVGWLIVSFSTHYTKGSYPADDIIWFDFLRHLTLALYAPPFLDHVFVGVSRLFPLFSSFFFLSVNRTVATEGSTSSSRTTASSTSPPEVGQTGGPESGRGSRARFSRGKEAMPTRDRRGDRFVRVVCVGVGVNPFFSMHQGFTPALPFEFFSFATSCVSTR